VVGKARSRRERRKETITSIIKEQENTRYAAIAVHYGYGLIPIIFFVRRRYAVADSKDIKKREMREEGDWKVRREERGHAECEKG
jgi:hypothetical protein